MHLQVSLWRSLSFGAYKRKRFCRQSWRPFNALSWEASILRCVRGEYLVFKVGATPPFSLLGSNKFGVCAWKLFCVQSGRPLQALSRETSILVRVHRGKVVFKVGGPSMLSLGEASLLLFAHESHLFLKVCDPFHPRPPPPRHLTPSSIELNVCVDTPIGVGPHCGFLKYRLEFCRFLENFWRQLYLSNFFWVGGWVLFLKSNSFFYTRDFCRVLDRIFAKSPIGIGSCRILRATRGVVLSLENPRPNL